MVTKVYGTQGVDKVQDNVIATADLQDGAVTAAKIASGVAGTGPAFSAYLPSNQTISSATWTKVTLSAEDFDTANCFNTSTYQFTPTVAGYYSITGSVFGGAGGNLQNFFVRISKNGTSVSEFGDAYTSAILDDGFRSNTMLVYLNGSTDYMELYAYQTGGATGLYGNGSNPSTRLSGFLARAA